MNEKEAIQKFNEILEEWQKILNIEDEDERECEMSMYFEDMPFIEIQAVLQALKDKDNRIDELEKALVDEDFKYRNRIKVLNNRINQVKKYIENIMNSCNGANLGDLQMLLDILKGEI